jgi:hypothetical protein
MSVTLASATITINPAFLQEIKDSNLQLWHTLHEVRQLCHAELATIAISKRLVPLLDELRDHLALQFALEDAYGYFSGPSQVDAIIAARAASIKEQHCQLYLELSELCENAEELQYRGITSHELAAIISQTLVFDRRLQQHERDESQLIEAAYHDQRIYRTESPLSH